MPDEPKAPRRPTSRGPFTPTVYVPPPKEESGAPFPVEPALTEGMKARRRELAKRRRDKALKALEAEENRNETWLRIRSVLLRLLLLFAFVFGYWRLQVEYPDNRWPLEMVWVLLVVGIFGGFFWAIWYMNKVE